MCDACASNGYPCLFLSYVSCREHPELSEDLCEEMMTRALECRDATIQHPVLVSLRHWMSNLSIQPQWKVKGVGGWW
jgi:hypothetical protein